MKFFPLILVVCSLCSCNVISFDEYSVTMNPGSDLSWYDGDYIAFSFNCDVARYYVEKSINLTRDNSNCDIEYLWTNSSVLKIKPKENWLKGSLYKCEMNGTLFSINGDTFSVLENCTFYYGRKVDSFILADAPFDENDVPVNRTLEFHFNHRVSKNVFEESFSLTPDVSYRIESDEEKRLYKIIPLTKWDINKRYCWSFEKLISDDSWILTKNTEGSFQTVSDTELPELQKICSVSSNNADAVWNTEFSLSGNVSRKMSIGFIFSKPMNFDSVKSNISFSPSISGYFMSVPGDNAKFLFVPEENYSIETEYLITIDKNIEDLSGLNLFEDYKEIFFSEDTFLYVQSISFGPQTVLHPSEEVQPEISRVQTLPNSSGKNEITADILFSMPINENKLLDCENTVSLSLVFPLTSVTPVKTAVKWNSTRDMISITWENMTESTDSFETVYLLKITGGKSGAATGDGAYLKDNICAYLNFYL